MKTVLRVLLAIIAGAMALATLPLLLVVLLLGGTIFKGLLILCIIGVAAYELGSLLCGGSDSIFGLLDDDSD